MRAVRGAVALAWLVGNLAWLSADRIVRDGDEEGHVGAAELFRGQLAAGEFGAFLPDALWGALGDYPPLHAAWTGLWWWATGAGQPGAVVVRAGQLLGPLLAAVAVAGLARRLAGRGDPERAATGAFVAALLLPLGAGLGRHFMPEGLLIAAVAGAVAVAAWAAERPTPGRALALGAALGLALLVKQTAVLLFALPVLAAGWRLGWRWALVAAGAAAVAGPWAARHWGEQVAYGAASVAGSGEALAHALYYPWALGAVVLGPVLLGATLAATAALARDRDRRTLAVGLAWLVGGAAVLTLVPKKYPRLAAPLGPGAALLCGVALSRRRRPDAILATGGVAAAGWLAAASLDAAPTPPPPAGGVDPRCPQRWLRAPIATDLGLAAVSSALADLPDGPVRVVGGPAIPCALQTTHDWAHHLSPYLRRDGRERAVVAEGPAAATVTWAPGPPAAGTIAVPALDGGFLVAPAP